LLSSAVVFAKLCGDPPRGQQLRQAQAEAEPAERTPGGRLRPANWDHILVQGRTTATQKVVNYFLLISRRISKQQGSAMVLPMSPYDIADHVGIAVETVSRATEAELLNALLSTKVYCPRRKLGVAIPIGSQPIPSINILSRHFCYLPVVPPLGRFSDFRRPNSAPPKFGGASFCPGGGAMEELTRFVNLGR
jgi:hypothetical protein